jgi:hypothetical protein
MALKRSSVRFRLAPPFFSTISTLWRYFYFPIVLRLVLRYHIDTKKAMRVLENDFADRRPSLPN